MVELLLQAGGTADYTIGAGDARLSESMGGEAPDKTTACGLRPVDREIPPIPYPRVMQTVHV